MRKLRPTEDVQPLTAFRANAASFVEQVRQTHRPLILTQHGKSAAVLLGAAEYEALLDELELLRDVSNAEHQIDSGRGIPHEEAVERLRDRLKASSG
jgi:prevent-host-death family protein